MQNIQSQSSGRVRFIILNIIRLLLVAAIIGAYFSQRWLVFFVGLIALLITFIPAIIRKKYKAEFPAELELIVVLFIYGSLFLGEVRGFAPFWWWDIILNLCSAIALGFVGLTIISVLCKNERINTSSLIVPILSFSLAFSISSLWEIFEFSLDNFFNFDLQKASLNDTMIDLIVNAIGIGLVSIAGYLRVKSGRGSILSGAVVNFIEKYPKIFALRKRNPQKEIKDLIKQGESETLEFKSTIRTNLHTKEVDRNIEFAALKTIAAFLNSKGGTLLVGVSNEGKLKGIKKDKFQNQDKVFLHITNLIKDHIGNTFIPFISKEIVQIDSKEVLRIDCKPSNKIVFIKRDNEEHFYVRSGPASIKLEGNALVDYIEYKFKKG